MQDIEEIYNKYAQIVYKYIFCLTKNKDISEDIVQETFLVAVKNIDKFRGESKISTWLCQIAKYIMYKEIKKEKKQKNIPLEEIENELIIQNSLEKSIVLKEEKLELLKKIQKLNDETKSVMYLKLLGGLKIEEIAEIMNRTPNWVRVIYFRGKQKIKEDKNEKRM